MTKRLPEEYQISVGDVEVVSVDYTDHLESGELISSSGMSAVEVTTTGNVTIGSPSRNTTAYTTHATSKAVAVSEAVQFTFTATAAGLYEILVTAVTDGNPARTFKRTLFISVI